MFIVPFPSLRCKRQPRPLPRRSHSPVGSAPARFLWGYRPAHAAGKIRGRYRFHYLGYRAAAKRAKRSGKPQALYCLLFRGQELQRIVCTEIVNP